AAHRPPKPLDRPPSQLIRRDLRHVLSTHPSFFSSTRRHTRSVSAFLLNRSSDLHSFPKHLFQGYLNIYNNYFEAPWMPDRTEANPNELNQDDARYGFRCCHLKNIWTAPLPPETELSRQMTTSTTSID